MRLHLTGAGRLAAATAAVGFVVAAAVGITLAATNDPTTVHRTGGGIATTGTVLLERIQPTARGRKVALTAVDQSGRVWVFPLARTSPDPTDAGKVVALRGTSSGSPGGLLSVKPTSYSFTGARASTVRLRRAAISEVYPGGSVGVGVDPYPDPQGVGELCRLSYAATLGPELRRLAKPPMQFRDLIVSVAGTGLRLERILAASPGLADPSPPAALAQAVKLLHTKGYGATTETWNVHDAVNALIGVPRTSADGYRQLAFFFVRGRYLGTDTTTPSTTIRQIAHSADTVTLRYGLYRSTDANCCPSSHASVRYRFEGTRLVALDPIPTGDPHAPLHR